MDVPTLIYFNKLSIKYFNYTFICCFQHTPCRFLHIHPQKTTRGV
nr:MAG TPA: hypothetical protein [Caudoviricetes sp.]